MTELEQLRAAHMARAQSMVPEFLGRLRWDAATLAAHRRKALRELVAHAVDRSPWHRKRLKGVDLDALDPDDLSALPVMTKAELMADWDQIVTDDRLRLSEVNSYLENAADGGYLFDEYTAVATGGSTGHRGVTVHDREGMATIWLALFRRMLIALAADPVSGPLTVGYVTASHPSHASAAVARTFRNPAVVNVICPVTWPLARIVETLNEAQPAVLGGYPSMLGVLAEEARAGRLRISPRQVAVGGEPLLPETRAAAEAAWGRPVQNAWGASEVGSSRPAARPAGCT